MLGCAGFEGLATGGALTGTAPTPWPITAMSTPTSTVSPSGTKISNKMPAAGAGTSVSTLSVPISKRVSSSSIASPTFLCHAITVPLCNTFSHLRHYNDHSFSTIATYGHCWSTLSSHRFIYFWRCSRSYCGWFGFVHQEALHLE